MPSTSPKPIAARSASQGQRRLATPDLHLSCHYRPRQKTRAQSHLRRDRRPAVVARDRLGGTADREPREGAFVPKRAGVTSPMSSIWGWATRSINTDNVIARSGSLSDNEGLGLSRRRIHRLGLRASCRRSGARRGTNTILRRSRCTPGAMILRNTLGADHKKYHDRRPAAGLPGLSRPLQCKAHHPSNYVMLKGVNGFQCRCARAGRCFKGLPAKINLIPFNPGRSSQYGLLGLGAYREFSEIVYRAGYASAGAHSARARHPRRLRPAQERRRRKLRGRPRRCSKRAAQRGSSARARLRTDPLRQSAFRPDGVRPALQIIVRRIIFSVRPVFA